MANILDGLIKDLSKKFDTEGLGMFKLGVSTERFSDTLSLGSPALDFITYNSIPKGIFIEIAGPESSGKTTTAYLIAADFVKKEKKAKADRDKYNAKVLADWEAKCIAAKEKGKKEPPKPAVEEYVMKQILFMDAEGTADPVWAKKSTGYDMNDPEVQTVYVPNMGLPAEQLFDICIDAMKSGLIGLIIFDSLVAIAGKQVYGESLEKVQMGGIAVPLGNFCKRATGLMNKFRTTFIGLNGIYMDPSGYGNPEKVGGGLTWKRACSLRLMTRRGKAFNAKGEELKETENGAIGHYINVALLKTKFCRWDRKLAQCTLNYTRGIDILKDTIDVARYFNIIQEPSKGYFQVTDPDTGEILTDKIHGAGNVAPYFEEHLEIWRRVYDKCYTMMSIKEVPNAISFEQMLGIDLNEEFGQVLQDEIHAEDDTPIDESQSVFAGVENGIVDNTSFGGVSDGE